MQLNCKLDIKLVFSTFVLDQHIVALCSSAVRHDWETATIVLQVADQIDLATEFHSKAHGFS